MGRGRWGAALVTTLVVTASGSASAAAAAAAAEARAPDPRDVTATRRFVAAETRFDRAELAHRAAITDAGRHYVKVVKAGCGGALATSRTGLLTPHEKKVVKALSEEASYDLLAVSTRPILPAERELERALRHVDFTQLRLKAIVASIEVGNRPATPGNACADITAAQATGFATEPPPTARLIKRLSALSAGSSTYVPRGLKPYLVTPADEAAYRTLQALDKRQTDFTDGFLLHVVGALVGALAG
jgi:hypothetical protein